MQNRTASSRRDQTRIAIETMHAYFGARRRGAPRQERDRLEREWLSAIQRIRTSSQ